jgi:glycerol-3-phosphate dehydrogenase (NAD(P)+)
MGERVAVINAGGWGTALAVMLANRQHNVTLWARRAELADELLRVRENRTYLPGVALPPNLHATASLADALAEADAVVLVPISRAMRELATAIAPHLKPGARVLHATKGFEHPSLLRLSQVVEESLGPTYADRVAVLSGPTHAEEVGRGLPSTAVVASKDAEVAGYFQQLFHGPVFRVYRSSDIAGVELCAGLKNVVAIASGGSDGMGFGDNARAGLITRSLAELGRLVHAAGGDPRTVSGLAGLGDVVATCTSSHSRNRWAGEQIGRGRQVEEILASTPQVVEGIPAARAAVALGQRYGVDLPVCQVVYDVVEGGAPVAEALTRLMSRDPAAEL